MRYIAKPLKIIQVHSDIASRTDLTGNEKLILGVIRFLCRKKGRTKAGNTYIGLSTGIGRAVVANTLSSLKTRGFLIVKVHRNAQGKVWSRELTITLPPHPQSLLDD